MTLCLAAECVWGAGDRAFVLCTDGRLDGESWGADDAAYKTYHFGFNFLGLMAGNWPNVRSLCSVIDEDFQELPVDAIGLLNLLRASSNRFRESSMFTGHACAVIVTGFIGKNFEPIMLYVVVDENEATVKRQFDIFAIGAGAQAAEMILRHRGYDPLNTRANKACYLLYEAKMFAETLTSVGPRNRIKIHYPWEHRLKEKECARDLSQADIEILEGMRKSYFLQEIPKHVLLTTSTNQKYPQSTKVDPSLPPPSPELLEESGES